MGQLIHAGAAGFAPRNGRFQVSWLAATAAMLVILGSGVGLMSPAAAHAETAGDFAQNYYLYEAEA